jgi:hypothetical protein
MTKSTLKTYILNDERFGSEAYLVHADNDEQLIADMPCIVDWANEHYESLDTEDTTTREECLAGKIQETWDALEPTIEIPGRPELVACYSHGKYDVYEQNETDDVLRSHSQVDELSEISA